MRMVAVCYSFLRQLRQSHLPQQLEGLLALSRDRQVRTKRSGAECPLEKLDALFCATPWQGIGGGKSGVRGLGKTKPG